MTQHAGCGAVGSKTETKDDTYGPRTKLPVAHCDKNDKNNSIAESSDLPHLTSTNRYTTCGDSIRKPLAADRLRANCCLRGIQKWDDSMYKDKNTPRNPSTNNIHTLQGQEVVLYFTKQPFLAKWKTWSKPWTFDQCISYLIS